MARPERFELPTNWFEASYSIQLSYGRVEAGLYLDLRKASRSYIHPAFWLFVLLPIKLPPNKTGSKS